MHYVKFNTISKKLRLFVCNDNNIGYTTNNNSLSLSFVAEKTCPKLSLFFQKEKRRASYVSRIGNETFTNNKG